MDTVATLSDRKLLWRILAEARPYGGRIGAVYLLGLLATPLALLGPVPLKIAVDSILGSDPLPGPMRPLVPDALQESALALLLLAAGLQVAVVVMAELQVLATRVLEAVIGENLTLRFRARLLAHVQRLSFGFHDSRGTADSIYRIQYDAPAIQRIALQGVLPLLSATVTFVAMVYVLLKIDHQLALVALAVSPLVFASAQAFRRRARPQYKRAARLESRAMGVVQEILTSFRVVKAYGREEQERERFVDESNEGMRLRIRLSLVEQAFGMLVKVFTAVGMAAVLFVGIRNVQQGVLTVGELLMAFNYMGRLYDPLQTIAKRLASLQRRLASAQRAFELLDEVPEVAEHPQARPLPRASGAVSFRNVSFAYGDGRPILRDLCFEVPKGSHVGVAGPTGAGKTTLVSLLSRFYDPTSGQILLDGVDLREYRLDDLRNQFAIMLQEPVLFSTTIGENIAYARPTAEPAQIEEAARAAGAHDFIAALAEGYDTVVGERGMRLSGGERQRISLARAYLRDAPVLILDEPTSSVDLATEAAILKALERLMNGRTTFMIAHSPVALGACDRMLELQNGQVHKDAFKSGTV